MVPAQIVLALCGTIWGCNGGKDTGSSSTSSSDTSSQTGTDSAQDTAIHTWGDVVFDADAIGPELLSEVGLLHWDGSTLAHHPDATEYRLNTPLFSDYALKSRAIWMPDGTQAQWPDDGVLAFPAGTILAKSFLFPADLRAPDQDLRLIETRLLVHGTEGWDSWPYVWRTDGSDADRKVGGEVQVIDFIGSDGTEQTANYLIPQRNQCAECHEMMQDDVRTLVPLGTTPRNLNREQWLEDFVAAGRLKGAKNLEKIDTTVDWDEIESRGIDALSAAEVVTAARDYLDVNCAHCHSPQGIEGITSQFFLNHDNTDEFNLGICKRPGSAGEGGKDREFDIVPGNPYDSIVWYRLDTEDVGAMMPQIGRSLSHTTGSQLVWRWIEEMKPVDCDAQ